MGLKGALRLQSFNSPAGGENESNHVDVWIIWKQRSVPLICELSQLFPDEFTVLLNKTRCSLWK